MRYTGTEYERLWATGSLTGTSMSPNNLTKSLGLNMRWINRISKWN